MSSKPILVIKDTPSTIGVRARVGDEFSEHEIQLSLMLAYYWDNNLPVIENLIDLFETVVKRTINEVIPHKNLYLKYNLITDGEISTATRFEIHLIEVKADNIDLRLDGKILALKGIRSQEEYSYNFNSQENMSKEELLKENMSDDEDNKNNLISEEFELKIEELVEKTIPSEEKLSFKDFIKQQKANKGL